MRRSNISIRYWRRSGARRNMRQSHVLAAVPASRLVTEGSGQRGAPGRQEHNSFWVSRGELGAYLDLHMEKLPSYPPVIYSS
jgi:hypothetical protein